MRKLFFSALLLAVFMFNKAQEKDIEEVVVTGKVMNLPYKKSNTNVTVISKSQIESLAAQSVEEVLAYYTGIDVRKRGANGVQTDMSMRGSNFEQVLLLINGIRINDAQTGHNSMNLPFDVSSVERIEILKGPAARRFGQGAYAGVINIVTKPSSENNIILNGEGGDFNSYPGGVASNFGNENFRNFVQVNHSQSDGYRYNTDYKVNNVYYQNQYKISNGNVKFQVGFQEKKFGANGFYASPIYTDQYEEIQMAIVSAGLEKKISENIGFNANIYWKRAQDMYLLKRNNPSFYRNMHIGNNVGVDVSANYKSFLGNTGLGVDVRKEFLESNRLGSRERLVSQAFLEHHFSFFNESLNISPGISWSNIEGENYLYPGIDVSYTEENNKVFANFSKVNRIPTYTDLYYMSPLEQGNPNLVPENALSGELGYQYQENQSFIKYSMFWRKTDNAIDWQKETPSSPWKAQNIGTIETKGFELEANHQVNSWLSYAVGYTYLDNQRLNDEVISRYSLDNLKHQFVAKLKNQFKGFSNELIYRYNERVNLGSYNLLDDKISYQFSNVNLYVLVNNITNSDYVETSLVPMSGRWFHVGFTYKLNFK
jgi:iron complex outermembrane receptor protein